MKPILLLAALALAAPAAAQDADDAPSEEARAAAERYIQSDAMQAMMDDMFSPDALSQAMSAQMGGQVPPDVMDQIATIATEEIAAVEPQVEEAMIQAAAETFTVEEIEAQMEFYASDVGASVLRKTQPFMTAFYEEAGPAMQEMQQAMMQRLQETMPDQQ